jgi:hypothetical protein
MRGRQQGFEHGVGFQKRGLVGLHASAVLCAV